MDAKSNNIIIHFPCVHGFAKGQLIQIKSFSAEEPKGTLTVIGIGHNDEYAKKVVDASRYNESDGRAGVSVIAAFSTPNFIGESYGLALAIADKLARLPGIHQYKEIYATGVIHADSCGRISEVNGFEEKLDLLSSKGQLNDIFIYPKDNLSTNSDTIQEKINLLKSKGVKCLAISNIDDLSGILWSQARDTKVSLGNIRAGFLGIQFPFSRKHMLLGFFIIVFVSILVFYNFNSYQRNLTTSGEVISVPQTTSSEQHLPVRASNINKQQVENYGEVEGLGDEANQPVPPSDSSINNGSRIHPVIESNNTDPSPY